MEKNDKAKKVSIIRYIYLYLVTAITIVMIIVSAVGFIKLALEEYVFDVKGWGELENPKNYYECTDDFLFYTYDANGQRVAKDPAKSKEQMEAEKEQCLMDTQQARRLQDENEVKRELVWWLSMLVVALPLYLLHWGIIRKESKK